MTPAFAEGVLDGAMLSDATVKLARGARSINPTPVFVLAQAGVGHIDWLDSVRKALAVLGTNTSEVKEYVDNSHGKAWKFTQFHSHVSNYVAHLRNRWYPNGVKVVPADLNLTPVTTANWFMGDGLSSFDRRFQFTAVTVRLCTHSFSVEDVVALIGLLYSMGIYATIGYNKRLPHINISQWSVDHFMDIVEPHIASSYLYKVKRRHSVPQQEPPKEVIQLL